MAWSRSSLASRTSRSESIVITEQRDRWLAAGSPPVTSSSLTSPHVLQRRQAWSLLDLPGPPPSADAVRVAWTSARSSGRGSSSSGRRGGKPCFRSAAAARSDTSRSRRRHLVGIAALTRKHFSTGWFHWPGNPVTGATGDSAVVGTGLHRGANPGTARAARLRAARRACPGGRCSSTSTKTLRQEQHRVAASAARRLSWARLLEAQRLTRSALPPEPRPS